MCRTRLWSSTVEIQTTRSSNNRTDSHKISGSNPEYLKIFNSILTWFKSTLSWITSFTPFCTFWISIWTLQVVPKSKVATKIIIVNGNPLNFVTSNLCHSGHIAGLTPVRHTLGFTMSCTVETITKTILNPLWVNNGTVIDVNIWPRVYFLKTKWILIRAVKAIIFVVLEVCSKYTLAWYASHNIIYGATPDIRCIPDILICVDCIWKDEHDTRLSESSCIFLDKNNLINPLI